MTEEKEFTYEVNMEKLENYKFIVDFGKKSIPSLLMDETKDIPGGRRNRSYSVYVNGSCSRELFVCIFSILSFKKKSEFKKSKNNDYSKT